MDKLGKINIQTEHKTIPNVSFVVSLNEGVQDLYGGLNIVSRGIEIQVSEENVEKVTELINAEPQLTNPL